MEKVIQGIIKYEKLLAQIEFEHWVNNVVFTPRWWGLLASLFIPWILWFILVHKKEMLKVLIYYFSISAFFLAFDEIGNSLTLWAYPIKIVSFFPRFVPMCCSLSPAVYSLLYQYFPGWRSFMFASIIASAVLSLIILPLAAQHCFIIVINWKFIYSTAVFSIAASISKLFTDKVDTIEYKSAA